MNAHPLSSTRRYLLLAAATALFGRTSSAASVSNLAPGTTSGITPSQILIGQNLTLLGGRSAFGVEALAGAKACLDQANREGGAAGRQIVLRSLDDHNQPEQAEGNARHLVQSGVFMLFGSIEGAASNAVQRVAVEHGVPLFGPMAGLPAVRRPHQAMVFPVRAEHREEFRALINHGQARSFKKVALFHADSALGREHLDNVQALASAAGLGFGGGLAFKSDITDAELDVHVTQMAARGIDLVINHGAAPIYERLIRRARQAGLATRFWGVNSGSTPLAAALGPLAHGMVFSQVVPRPWSNKTALVREYQQQLQRAVPGAAPSYASLEGYMTAKALVLALRAAGNKPSRAGLLDALQNFDADLGGVPLRYRAGQHTGCTLVELALVGRDGRFVQ